MTDMEDFVERLRDEFLEEAMFLLEQCEESYLKLECPDNRASELAKIFRVAHTIKGSGATVGFEDLVKFAHIVEDCLTMLRAEPEAITTEIVSLLLRSGDALKCRIFMLKSKSLEIWNIDTLVAEIKAVTTALENANEPTLHHKAQPYAQNLPPCGDTTSADGSWGIFETGSQVLESVTPSAMSPSKQTTEHANHAPKDRPLSSASELKCTNTMLKVDSGRIEGVLNLIGELVVIKSQLLTKTESYRDDGGLNSVVSLLDKTVRELQDKSIGIRLTSLKPLFLKLQRLVRDLSIKLNKPVEMEISGEDTEIERNMVEQLADPLMHIMRNALDHGIESSEIRKMRGKSPKGMIRLIAKTVGSRISVQITDDGGGINRDKVVRKATERGLITSLQSEQGLSDKDVYKLLMEPGFSTADIVSDLSGRGVGLDVARSNIEVMHGKIDIESQMDKGTRFILSLPLTTSITDGMIVSISGNRYVIQMDNICELLKIDERQRTDLSKHSQFIEVRGRQTPLFDLSEVFPMDYSANTLRQKSRAQLAIVVELEGNSYAIKVDAVHGQTQVVLKPLDLGIDTKKGIAGSAILGDGRVGLVIDVQGIVEIFSQKNNTAHEAEVA